MEYYESMKLWRSDRQKEFANLCAEEVKIKNRLKEIQNLKNWNLVEIDNVNNELLDTELVPF